MFQKKREGYSRRNTPLLYSVLCDWVGLLASADAHNHTDEDRCRYDYTEQVLNYGAARIGSGDDICDQTVDDHKGDYADYYGYYILFLVSQKIGLSLHP